MFGALQRLMTRLMAKTVIASIPGASTEKLVQHYDNTVRAYRETDDLACQLVLIDLQKAIAIELDQRREPDTMGAMRESDESRRMNGDMEEDSTLGDYTGPDVSLAEFMPQLTAEGCDRLLARAKIRKDQVPALQELKQRALLGQAVLRGLVTRRRHLQQLEAESDLTQNRTPSVTSSKSFIDDRTQEKSDREDEAFCDSIRAFHEAGGHASLTGDGWAKFMRGADLKKRKAI